jgi:hypothetical protein
MKIKYTDGTINCVEDNEFESCDVTHVWGDSFYKGKHVMYIMDDEYDEEQDPNLM